MAKITRKLQKIFGSGVSPTDNIAVFGSLKLGVPAFSDNPDLIQSNEYVDGWKSAVINNNSPALQDMNALQYLFSRQLAYLMQAGIPEWNTDTVYYIGSFVQSAGVIYISLTDDNTGNAVSDSTKWDKQAYDQYSRTPTAGLYTDNGTRVRPYKTPDGTWRAQINISGNARGQLTPVLLYFEGMVFKSSIVQSLSFAGGTSAEVFTIQGQGKIKVQSLVGGALYNIFANGDVELDSKPTFVP